MNNENFKNWKKKENFSVKIKMNQQKDVKKIG